MEKIIDKFGVSDTLLMISDICSAKAEHIVANWQDMPLGEKWGKAGNVIRRAVRDLPKVPGIK